MDFSTSNEIEKQNTYKVIDEDSSSRFSSFKTSHYRVELPSKGTRNTVFAAQAVPQAAAWPAPSRRPVWPRLSVGFQPRSRLLYRAYNFTIGMTLFLMILPLFLVITALLALTQGAPIFYRGPRIGENGELFDVYKFRTLDSAKAAQITKDKVLPKGSGIETPMGLFLRETRLDEIPQLLNVIKGDMNMCGPRPVRPEIAAQYAAAIPNYERRFRVKPGMIGPAQAYMSHGTSKAIRSRLNNKLCGTDVSYLGEISLVFIVGACVLARTVARVGASVFGRKTERIEAARARVYDMRFVSDDGQSRAVFWVDEDQLILDQGNVLNVPVSGRLTMILPDGQTRSAAVELSTIQATAPNGRVQVAYKPKSEFSEHILSRYLFQSVVVPHRSEFLSARLRRALTRSRAV
ncbi:sugar transferase [Salipiger mangrovisoli]|uniref:Sugar transferase n=1 Tax=Salipiger mangrovisoli TaxID=2865933 RepID=A0ABR9WZI1_9RHOB|nr:sugar transferase [Salipiger mangrovisoli]MBE9636656.1 sugar transferase [Salipiger mangrovisoli]